MSAGFALALCAISFLQYASAAIVPIPLQPRADFQTGQALRSTDSDSAIFQPDYAQRESLAITAKYQQADVMLQGVNLSPSAIKNSQNGLVAPDVSSGLPAVTTVQVLPLRAVTGPSGAVLSYQAAIEIGTPPQQLDVVLDTGVADSWVATQCSECEGGQFSPPKSATFHGTSSDFQQAYGVGYVWGTLGRDNISAAGFTASPQYFGAVNTMDEGNAGYAASGVLGFAFGALSISKTTPFFESLMQQKSIPSPLFGVALGPGGIADDSEICLGCISNGKFSGALTWVPLVSHTYWTIAITGLYVTGLNTMSRTNTLLATLDTASNQIHVPMDVATAFYAAIPGSNQALDYGAGFWTFPCTANLNVSLSLNGHSFSLDPRDFNLGRTSASSDDCVGAVLGMQGSGLPDDFAVIGAAFLRSWYTVFDYSSGGRVGFGRMSSA